MTTATLCKKLLGVKNTVVESYDFYTDSDGVNHLKIYARANESMPEQMYGIRMSALTVAEDIFQSMTGLHEIRRYGEDWILVALSLRLYLKLTVSFVRITVWLPPPFHGPILPAALRRNSILQLPGLQSTCPEAL